MFNKTASVNSQVLGLISEDGADLASPSSQKDGADL